MFRNKIVRDATPIIQWANGRAEARRDAKGRFASHVGWHVEAQRYDAFDAAAADLNLPQIVIRHQRPGGEAVLAPHWDLGEEIRFFPLTAGPVAPTVSASWSEAYREETVAAGIGIRWSYLREAEDRSRLAVRGYVAVLTGKGWQVIPTLAQISVKSRMTDALLAALADHVRVCEIADQLVDRARHPGEVLLHEVALPLGPGEEETWGRGDTATVTPLRSLHPEEVDATYLRGVWRPEEVVAWAEADWSGVQAWARDFASREARYA